MTSYDMVRGFAPMIREVVRTKRMPPWHADPHYGAFVGDRSLSSEESQDARSLGRSRRAARQRSGSPGHARSDVVRVDVRQARSDRRSAFVSSARNRSGRLQVSSRRQSARARCVGARRRDPSGRSLRRASRPRRYRRSRRSHIAQPPRNRSATSAVTRPARRRCLIHPTPAFFCVKDASSAVPDALHAQRQGRNGRDQGRLLLRRADAEISAAREDAGEVFAVGAAERQSAHGIGRIYIRARGRCLQL